MSRDVRIAFVGDSFTAGAEDDAALGWVGRVVARARAAGWPLTGYNLGVRRETTLDVLDRLAAEAGPRLRDGDALGLVVSSGINDTTVVAGQRRVDVADTLAALDRIVDIAAAARWPLLFVGPALVGEAEQNDRIIALSDAMAERCHQRAVPCVGIAGALLGDQAWLAEVSSVDGSHPGASGYKKLADLVWPAFLHWVERLVPAGETRLEVDRAGQGGAP